MAAPAQTAQSPPVPQAAAEGPQGEFELAVERARARFPTTVWWLLEPGRRTGAIYAELRLIDGEGVRAQSKRG
jgi:hypothetical protein